MQLLTIALIFTASLGATPSLPATYTCRVGSDPLTVNLRDHIVQVVTGTDTASAARRVEYNLPSTTANKVTVVGTGSTCNQAGVAFHAATKAPGTPAIDRTLVVLKVSTTRYVVKDYAEVVGEFATMVIFDKNWIRLTTWN